MPTIYAIGIGPGGRNGLTEEAYRAIESADEVLGYTVYAELVQKIFPEKTIRSTPMKKERERCRMALEAAKEGKTVAMVCSGDSGVYGMAGLLYELLPEYSAEASEKAGTAKGSERPGAAEDPGQPVIAEDPFEIRVIPGVTAALSGAAVLGAPLSNDFCTISLSDLMTPWEEIEKRLRCAAQADFAVALYNPMSKTRTDHLRKACQILMEGKSPETVCGWVRNIGREGEEKKLLTLKELSEETVDMFTTVFIGTKNTVILDGAMVTRRGYR